MSGHRKKRATDEKDEEEEEEELEVWRKNSSVYFYSDVNRASVAKLIKLLCEASECSVQNTPPLGEPRVHLFIHSDGGDAYAGLSAMDHVACNPVEIITIADGFVASAASLILLGSDTRYIMPHAHVLIHQLRTGFIGKYDELRDEMQNSEGLMKSFRTIYKDKTTMDPRQIDALLCKELNLDADDCLRYGIAHRKLGPPSAGAAKRTGRRR